MAIYTIETRWKERLFSIFRHSPHILKIIETAADPLQDTIDVCEFVLNDGIDTAEGEQLEFWAELLGIQWPLAQEDPSNIFTLCGAEDVLDRDGHTGFASSEDDGLGNTVIIGGYMTAYTGIPSQTDPGSLMPIADFRKLIKQKAALMSVEMTLAELFNYYLEFGAQTKLTETGRTVTVDLVSYYDLDEWQKWYAENKGFKPASIAVDIADNIRKVEI